MLEFPFKSDNASFATLANSQVADPETDEFDFINLFPVELPMSVIDTLGAGWRIIDFSLLLSVGPPKAVPNLMVGMKQLEMVETTRRALGDKLAAFFGRSQEARA